MTCPSHLGHRDRTRSQVRSLVGVAFLLLNMLSPWESLRSKFGKLNVKQLLLFSGPRTYHHLNLMAAAFTFRTESLRGVGDAGLQLAKIKIVATPDHMGRGG